MKTMKPIMINNVIGAHTFLCIVFIFSVVLPGCKTGTSYEGNANRKTINIGYTEKKMSKIMAYVCENILKDLNYNIELQHYDPDAIYEGIENNTIDLYLDARIKSSEQNLYNTHSSGIEQVGKSFRGARSGLLVPAHVYINAMTQLAPHAKAFDNKIYTYIPQHLKEIEQAQKIYALPFSVQKKTEEEIDTLLMHSRKENSWIVFYGVKPSSTLNNYNLKFLRDPLGVFVIEDYEIISRNGFRYDYPQVTSFLQNFELTNNKMIELLKNITNINEDIEQLNAWISQNRDMIESWYPPEW